MVRPTTRLPFSFFARMNFIFRNFKASCPITQHRFYTAAQPVSWTNASLKRLRKAQLESLAREHNLNTEGTKAQLIARLLNHPKEREWQQKVEEFEATEASHAHVAGNDTVEREMTREIQDEVTGRTGITSRHSHENELEAANWIEAFELKANQRRTRDRRAGSFFPGNRRGVTGQASESTTPKEEQQQQQWAVADNSMADAPEDMDVEWVKAFEQKTLNRATRKRDTFKASDARVDSMLQPEFEVTGEREPGSADIQDAIFSAVRPAVEPKETVDSTTAPPASRPSSSSSTHQNKSTTTTTTNSDPDSTQNATSSSSSSARDRVINVAVASSLAVWVTGGEEGFKKLVDILGGVS